MTSGLFDWVGFVFVGLALVGILRARSFLRKSSSESHARFRRRFIFVTIFSTTLLLVAGLSLIYLRYFA